MKAIVNGRFILPDETGDFGVHENIALLFDERIRRIAAEVPAGTAEVIDAAGNYVSPGFLNVHIHGCAGADTMDGEVEALRKMAVFQAQTGVTAFCPATMTNPWPKIRQALTAVRQAGQMDTGGARILGAHLEGPFVSAECCGAQPKEYIAKADFSRLEEFADAVALVTVAPEEIDAGDFYAACHRAGIVVSLGHSAASYELARQVIDDGDVTHITHLCNGMKPLHHRKPGTVGAALDTAVDCELIADNIHVHPFMQRLIYQQKRGQHIILITDSLRACGLGDGPTELGGQPVTVSGDLALLADGTIAGSVVTMNRAVANFAANTGAGVAKTVEFAGKVPAENLGIYSECGSLEVGKRADITIFDDEIKIRRTIVGGRTVYES